MSSAALDRATMDAIDASDPFATGSLVAGKYRVERELGAGGVGVVVLARHVELGQKFAIKYLRSSNLTAQALERFKREAKLAASLCSPHVVKVFDVGSLPDGTPFMVMEYLQGEDLNEVLVKGGPAPIDQAVQWTIEACEALAEAHELGIVHRDLKPANFFLSKRAGTTPIVKILDFGISKVTESSTLSELPAMTRQSEVFGTPYYMSPEQLVSSTDVDARSDIWAIGVCLYELLTRHLPFECDDLRQLVADILSSAPTPVRDHRADIPIELAQIVHRCLSYDPAQRPRTVRELMEKLRPYTSARYVGQLALAETAPEGSGLHHLGWSTLHEPSSAPPVSNGQRASEIMSVPAPRARSRIRLLGATIGGASLLLAAVTTIVFAARQPPPPAQALVGAELPREVVVTLPSALTPTTLTTASPTVRVESMHIEIIEVKDDAAVPVATSGRAPSPAKPMVRQATPPPKVAKAPATDDFGGRK